MLGQSQHQRKAKMIYRFSSKATGDVLMTGDVGTRLLHIMGKDVTAKGIIEVAAMPAAAQALAAAVAEDEGRLAQIAGNPGAEVSESADVDSATLRQHAWPLLEMLKQAQAAGEVIVWGV